jgi:hypothetical protein
MVRMVLSLDRMVTELRPLHRRDSVSDHLNEAHKATAYQSPSVLSFIFSLRRCLSEAATEVKATASSITDICASTRGLVTVHAPRTCLLAQWGSY